MKDLLKKNSKARYFKSLTIILHFNNSEFSKKSRQEMKKSCQDHQCRSYQHKIFILTTRFNEIKSSKSHNKKT